MTKTQRLLGKKRSKVMLNKTRPEGKCAEISATANGVRRSNKTDFLLNLVQEKMGEIVS